MLNATILEQIAFEKSRTQSIKDPDVFFRKDDSGDYVDALAQMLWEVWCSGHEYAQKLNVGYSLGMPASQEPKYSTKQGMIVNRVSGDVIPSDEPIFIFRARDQHAREAIALYACELTPGAHRDAVVARVADFANFAFVHPDRMKIPDTQTAKSAGNSGNESLPIGHHLYAVFRTRPDENDGHEFLSHAMWHGETTLSEGERQVRGFFFPDSALPLDNAVANN